MKSTRKRRPAHQDEVSYQRLREAITTGELMPSERLVEAGLAESMGVGRAAVRTAIARLAQERLVERLPNRGARVRRVADNELVEVLEVRAALECIAVRYAALNATRDDVRALRRIDVDGEFAQTNAEFHRALLRIARHETVTRVLEGLLSASFQLQPLVTARHPAERRAEHNEVITAIEAHNPDAAERAMRKHLNGVTERARRRVSTMTKGKG